MEVGGEITIAMKISLPLLKTASTRIRSTAPFSFSSTALPTGSKSSIGHATAMSFGTSVSKPVGSVFL